MAPAFVVLCISCVDSLNFDLLFGYFSSICIYLSSCPPPVLVF